MGNEVAWYFVDRFDDGIEGGEPDDGGAGGEVCGVGAEGVGERVSE